MSISISVLMTLDNKSVILNADKSIGHEASEKHCVPTKWNCLLLAMLGIIVSGIAIGSVFAGNYYSTTHMLRQLFPTIFLK